MYKSRIYFKIKYGGNLDRTRFPFMERRKWVIENPSLFIGCYIFWQPIKCYVYVYILYYLVKQNVECHS